MREESLEAAPLFGLAALAVGAGIMFAIYVPTLGALYLTAYLGLAVTERRRHEARAALRALAQINP